MQIAGAIGNRIAAPRSRLRIERCTGSVRVERLPGGVEVDRADMQRLVHVTDQVREQQQGLAAVADVEWRRCGPPVKHVDGGLQGAHHIVITGASERALVVVALDRDIGEVVALVTSDFAPSRVTLRRVAAHEVDHLGDAFGRLEGLACAVQARVGYVSPSRVVRLYVLDAIGPRRRHLKLHAERACDLACRMAVQQAVGHGAAEFVPLRAECLHRWAVRQGRQNGQQAKGRTQSFTISGRQRENARVERCEHRCERCAGRMQRVRPPPNERQDAKEEH